MKWIRNLSFQKKLFSATALLVLVMALGYGIPTLMTTTRQIETDSAASLKLITEQTLASMTSSEKNANQSLYASFSASSMLQEVYNLKMVQKQSGRTVNQERYLVNALGRIVTSNPMFSFVSLRLDNGDLYFSDTDDQGISNQVRKIFSTEENTRNTYGRVTWFRDEDTTLWMLRDVYSMAPMRHIGKVAVRINQGSLLMLSNMNWELGNSVLIFRSDGRLMIQAGEPLPGEIDFSEVTANRKQLQQIQVSDQKYLVHVSEGNEWTVIGFLPNRKVYALRTTVLRNILLVSAIAFCLGILAAAGFSRAMTRRLHVLTANMDRVSKGSFGQTLPVDSSDEIGVLTGHFNTMTMKIDELLRKLLEEEKRKSEAEFQNLEYEYRFLAWQINPHFIYNALETVNALAKIDGNDETCQMIQLLSAYFRRNAENMRTRFLTVSDEFNSLQQYVEIYQQIYGPRLDVVYEADETALRACLPSMILQALLENALVHGMNPNGNTVIRISGEIQKNELILSISDNGPGMTNDTMERIMGPRTSEPHGVEQRTSLGVRNVMDRLQLLYGNKAEMRILSRPGEGTTVVVQVPLSFTLNHDLLVAPTGESE